MLLPVTLLFLYLQTPAGLAFAIDEQREVCRNEIGIVAVVDDVEQRLVGECRFASATGTNHTQRILGVEGPFVLLLLYALRPLHLVQNPCRNEQPERII